MPEQFRLCGIQIVPKHGGGRLTMTAPNTGHEFDVAIDIVAMKIGGCGHCVEDQPHLSQQPCRQLGKRPTPGKRDDRLVQRLVGVGHGGDIIGLTCARHARHDLLQPSQLAGIGVLQSTAAGSMMRRTA